MIEAIEREYGQRKSGLFNEFVALNVSRDNTAGGFIFRVRYNGQQDNIIYAYLKGAIHSKDIITSGYPTKTYDIVTHVYTNPYQVSEVSVVIKSGIKERTETFKFS